MPNTSNRVQEALRALVEAIALGDRFPRRLLTAYGSASFSDGYDAGVEECEKGLRKATEDVLRIAFEELVATGMLVGTQEQFETAFSRVNDRLKELAQASQDSPKISNGE